MKTRKFFALWIAGVMLCAMHGRLTAQDFLLEGCFWQCSASDSIGQYVRQFQRDAPAWAHAGFTSVWLPEIPASAASSIEPLVRALRDRGLQPLVYLPAPAAGSGPEKILADAKSLRDQYRIRNLRLGPGLEAWHYAALLNVAISENAIPDVIVADPGRQRSAAGIAAWINAVYDQIPDADASRVFPRAIDYPLRETLRKACATPAYDVRNLFTAGLRNATSLTGFNAVSFVNAAFLPENETLSDPLLAYAYILSNNQLGLPMVHLRDYLNPEYKDAVDQLIEAHRKYIFNSTEVEYLNMQGSERRSVFLSAPEGTNEDRVLLFQMEGQNTPAGQAATPRGGRDVLVAINFSDAPLKVIQELNPSNLRPGDRFFDVLGLSDTPELTTTAGEAQGIPNAVYLELPPRSYSIWVQGETGLVLPGEIRFSARREASAIELSWEAPSGQGIRHFEIERSVNGGIFERIAKMESLPATGEATYLHLDESTERGKRYAYRVKAQKNGGYFYSPVANVESPPERIRLEIIPGSRPGERLLRIRSNVQGLGEMTLYDKSGKAVMTKPFPINIGEERRKIPLETLPPGLFMLDVRINGERVWVERIVKL